MNAVSSYQVLLLEKVVEIDKLKNELSLARGKDVRAKNAEIKSLKDAVLTERAIKDKLIVEKAEVKAGIRAMSNMQYDLIQYLAASVHMIAEIAENAIPQNETERVNKTAMENLVETIGAYRVSKTQTISDVIADQVANYKK